VFESKYAWRPEPDGDDGGTWYRLAPLRAYAGIEAEYPRTATRFDFVT
jgi:hypothetical protein